MGIEAVVRIGNSSIEWKVRKEAALRLPVSKWRSFIVSLKSKKVQRLCFASVVPSLSRELKKELRKLRIEFDEIRPQDVPLKLPYRDNIGVDRVLNVFALSGSRRESFVLIDFGTATTIEFYHARKGYLGGWICPGMAMLAHLLHAKTAKLPYVDPIGALKLRSRCGRSSRESIQLGYRAAVLGLINQADETARQLLGGSYRRYWTGGGSLDLPKLKLWRLMRGLQLEALRKIAENE